MRAEPVPDGGAYSSFETGHQPDTRTGPAPHGSFFGSIQAALRQSWQDGSLSLWLIAIAFWILTHGLRGIAADASLYIGRALADLDAAGVGRDMAFVHDGQSHFSLFPLVAEHLVAYFGTSPTALFLAVTATLVWLIALSGLIAQFLPARFVPIAVLCVALLPNNYGSAETFHYGEALAIPRPFAEALVLFALWALTADHKWRAFFLLVGASLIHPIMALPGWGVLGFVLCRENRRWYAVAAIVGIGAVTLALLGVPVVRRLVMPIDADLKAFAVYRIPYLFPTKWPSESFGRILIEATTILIAASFFEKRHRAILIGVLIVGVGGIVAQILLGDVASRLLIIQMQLWRAGWLLAALGAAMFGVAAVQLWKSGLRGQLVLAVLILAWLQNGELFAVAITCAAALLVHFSTRITIPISKQFVWAVWAVVACLALYLGISYLESYRELVSHILPDAYFPGNYLWGDPALAFPIIALVLAFHMVSRRSGLAPVEGVTALGLLVAALLLWDNRLSFQKLSDSGQHPPALMALIASRPGEVLWVGGLAESWFLTGRPQWASRQQGSGTIFSRELTVEWRERLQFLIAHGLAEPDAFIAFHVPPARDLPQANVAGVRALCARPDAPAWVIAPVMEGSSIPAELQPRYWRPGQPNFAISQEPTYFVWHRISAYAVLPCAAAAPNAANRRSS